MGIDEAGPIDWTGCPGHFLLFVVINSFCLFPPLTTHSDTPDNRYAATKEAAAAATSYSVLRRLSEIGCLRAK